MCVHCDQDVYDNIGYDQWPLSEVMLMTGEKHQTERQLCPYIAFIFLYSESKGHIHQIGGKEQNK